jgi:hypothetical protein
MVFSAGGGLKNGKNRHTAEEIVSKLRQVGALTAQSQWW